MRVVRAVCLSPHASSKLNSNFKPHVRQFMSVNAFELGGRYKKQGFHDDDDDVYKGR